ncbi:tRNA 5-methoxyuridine(34)/uridine 5-oxyacetic acid(34) synthase CmoB [Moraxella nasovis]|uniref:tRNA 5-methoxyuridine(34)/uridine 5-oxyacetic acid(34) synthase CmoB n=1 Tax=Moraxella nasovis TaxID=2904121 RepID=UPI001F6099DF|nr:tRNA 5-methoxyuridine(34)/uridine 5-oxyacetic acid(34) synthase CmoB [Moraxella nasovis]UNU73820.1 tRNA 5-methoxyuridine(34)/uridine 5-oxyacetic acid(34) synthase CmoB [Moraxella nasovis]
MSLTSKNNKSIAQFERDLYLTLLDLSQKNPQIQNWLTLLPTWLFDIKNKSRYAHAPFYASVIQKLPTIDDKEVCLVDEVAVRFQWQKADLKKAENLLKSLMPWRKGPFCLGQGDDKIYIDTEWRSDFKWDRVAIHLDLRHKTVLDVGGGSGYHGFRMIGAGADTVVVIDPSCLFYHQFMAVKHFVGEVNVHYIPVPLEALPASAVFDVVFSMGVLYHRASPFEHFEQVKTQLKKGGEFVLETLVIDGDENTVLVPSDRYAMMNNVYFLPSIKALEKWLIKAGFTDVRCVDINITTTDEQRATEWMGYQSLADFLDKDDDSKTSEGYPRPKRAVMIAKK